MPFGQHTTCPLQSRVSLERRAPVVWRKATAVHGWRALVAQGLADVDRSPRARCRRRARTPSQSPRVRRARPARRSRERQIAARSNRDRRAREHMVSSARASRCRGVVAARIRPRLAGDVHAMTRAGPRSAVPPSSSDVPSAERSRRTVLAEAPLFDGVFLAGFECACQRLADGRRLDVLAATRHDELVVEDYVRLRRIGMTACRDGLPWAFVERAGRFDFSRFAPMVRAARRHGIDVIWDLMRFGWPDDLNPFGAAFPARFGRYASTFARWISMETDRPVIVAPVSEMSLLARAGGDVRRLNPFEAARGVELKAQLVRATIEAIEGIRLVIPGARFLQPEPVIHIVGSNEHRRTSDARRVGQPPAVPGVGDAGRARVAVARRAPALSRHRRRRLRRQKPAHRWRSDNRAG